VGALIEVDNLNAGYKGVSVVRNLSLTVNAGEVVALLGSNGAGKTTTLLTIAGVLPAISGEVWVLGRSVKKKRVHQIARRGLALVPADRGLFFQLSVAENLRLGHRKGSKISVDDALGYFPALQPLLQRRCGLLSGGEQQMLAIGRALMSQPRVLLLDEPSLGLSPLITKDIFSIIGRINAETGTSILVVEQNAAIALKNSQFAYIMELGRIVAFGPSEELMQKQDVKDFYLGEATTTVNPRGREQRWKRRKTWR